MKFYIYFLIVIVFSCSNERTENIIFKLENYSIEFADFGSENAIVLPPNSKSKQEKRVLIKKGEFQCKVYFNFVFKIINYDDDTLKFPLLNVCKFYHLVDYKENPIVFKQNQSYKISPKDSISMIFSSVNFAFLSKKYSFEGYRVSLDNYLFQKQKISNEIRLECDSIIKTSKIHIIKCSGDKIVFPINPHH
jgi:hypothetical protein